VPDDAGEFDDDADFVDGYCAPLPPDDRLWRHPSEVSQPADADAEKATAGVGAGQGRRAGRRGGPPTFERALLPGPTRAGSWSAGLAGALLATGLVLVGTHLAAAMRQPGSTSRGNNADLTASTTALFSSGMRGSNAFGPETSPVPTVGRQLAQAAERVYAATVIVQATRGAKTMHAAGLVVGSDCLVVAPAALVAGALTLDLTLPDGRLVAATVLGVDDEAGIAVLRCEIEHMATVPNETEDATPHEMVALVYDAPPVIGLSFGLIVGADQRFLLGDGTPLLDAMSTDLPPTPDGAALVDGDGDVVGVVVGSIGGTAVATPTWLAESVARQFASTPHPAHAWLGIDGASVMTDGQPAGVRVQAVEPASAAARAGLLPGDVIRGLDGMGTASLVALQARLYCLTPGSEAEIEVLRGSKMLVEKTTLDHAPAA
jgi:S1-C subfamily serine protease